jgi:hypothetical protein
MTQSVLEELERTYKEPVREEKSKAVADKFNAAHYSTHFCNASRSFHTFLELHHNTVQCSMDHNLWSMSNNLSS